MIEKILKDTYVNPKVELTQTDYNRLVQTAQMVVMEFLEPMVKMVLLQSSKSRTGTGMFRMMEVHRGN